MRDSSYVGGKTTTNPAADVSALLLEEDVRESFSSQLSLGFVLGPQERVGADSGGGRRERVTKCMCTTCVSAAAAQLLTGQRAKTGVRLMAIRLCGIGSAASER